MAYNVRVFCTATAVPPLRPVVEWVKSDGYQLTIDAPFANVDLDSPDWVQVGLLYKPGKSALGVEVDRDDGSDRALVRDEVRHFGELLAEVAESPSKQHVLRHLGATKYIVAHQIPPDCDEDGFKTLSIWMTYFIRFCGGMVQADGQGFYDGDKLVVALK